jgi:hypothetical protein
VADRHFIIFAANFLKWKAQKVEVYIGYSFDISSRIFGLYQVIGGVCILVLPFTCTWFAKALNIM